MFMGLERQYNVCNFGLKAETHWSLKRRGEVGWSLKRRQRPTGRSSEGERSAGLSSEGRDPLVAQAKGRGRLVSQAKAETHWSLKRRGKVGWSLKRRQRPTGRLGEPVSPPRVCSPAVALLHKKGPCHRRKICANSLWLYFYYTQLSPSKNENINYIFIYLRVLRCLSSSSIYDTIYSIHFILYFYLKGF